MNDLQGDGAVGTAKANKAREVVLWLLGPAAFLVIAINLESAFGIPFAFSVRTVSLGFCQMFVWKVGGQSASDSLADFHF